MWLQCISSFGVFVVSLPVLLVRLDMLNVGTVFMSLFFIACGTLLCMSVYLIGNSTAFWYDSGGRTTIPYVAANVGQYAKYPVQIYPRAVQLLLLFVVPYAFICVVPVQVLRGQHQLFFAAATAAVSVAFFFLAKLVFERGIRHYESMGM